MSRPVVLGNGSLAVGLNEHGLVQDFYYPYVGLENLTNPRLSSHRIGVWVDGEFSWIGEDWEVTCDIEEDALISDILAVNSKLDITLHFQDTVLHDRNILVRHITIVNQSDESREIRLFMHQMFQISRGGRADTALYVPDEHYILDYKGRCSLLTSGRFTDSGSKFDQYAVGNFGIEGKEGTFRDAEDGELSGSTIEHGGVDSVIRFATRLDAGAKATVDYWIIAADSQFSGEKLLKYIESKSVSELLDENRQHWSDWLGEGANTLHTIPSEYLALTKKSLLIIKAHIDRRGGIIASCDSSIYNYGRDYYSYVWPRDGGFVLWPLIRLGHFQEARSFFEFCRDILSPDGYLMHKYQPDKAIGSTWHPLLHNDRRELAIQEDETAIVLYMLGEYYNYSKDKEFVLNLYETMVKPMANFMCDFVDEGTGLPHASYDLWEQKFLTNTFTVSVVYQALLVAGDFAEEFEYPDDAVKWRAQAEKFLEGNEIFYYPDREYFRKGFIQSPHDPEELQFDNILDVSNMYGPMMFGYYTDRTKLDNTVKAIERYLKDVSPSAGTPRYEHDQYFTTDPPYMGNPWFVTSLWMAQYYVRAGRLEEAEEIVKWAVAHALPSGVMSEQIHPVTGTAISVTPLAWSHAEFVNTVLDVARARHAALEE
jgi:GH15 family glucan-1,4-alpha-glucosidase